MAIAKCETYNPKQYRDSAKELGAKRKRVGPSTYCNRGRLAKIAICGKEARGVLPKDRTQEELRPCS